MHSIADRVRKPLVFGSEPVPPSVGFLAQGSRRTLSIWYLDRCPVANSLGWMCSSLGWCEKLTGQIGTRPLSFSERQVFSSVSVASRTPSGCHPSFICRRGSFVPPTLRRLFCEIQREFACAVACYSLVTFLTLDWYWSFGSRLNEQFSLPSLQCRSPLRPQHQTHSAM